MHKVKFSQVLTEAQMIKKFGLSKPQLDTLRRETDFPYVPVRKGVTVYIEQDVVGWFLVHREGFEDVIYDTS